MNIIKKSFLAICAMALMQNTNAQFVFDTIPSPNSQAITYDGTLGWSTMFVDRSGNIVSATSDTPYILKKYNYTSWYAPDSVNAGQYTSSGIPTEFASYPFDKNNNMWGGMDSVLVKINDTSTRTYHIPFYQYPSYVLNMCIDDSNHVWTLMSLYDPANTSYNSSLTLVKFDGTNWSKYRLVDYDTSGTLISNQPLQSVSPSNMYYKSGRIYMLNEDGSSGYFDGNYFTVSKYGWGDDPSGQELGISHGVTLVARMSFAYNNANTVTAYDSNDNIVFIDTLPSSVGYPQIFGASGVQQLDNNGTYWFQNTNLPKINTIYYYNPFTHISGKVNLPAYMGIVPSGYFYLQNICYNKVRNTLVINSTVNSTSLTNARPNARFMELNLDSFYSYLANIDTVWPGDADNNWMVDNNDLLPIGLAYDSTGPVRPLPGIVWQGDQSSLWNSSFANYTYPVNFNHADCNGDGIINADDTLAIITNFGDIHAKTNSYNGVWRSGIPGITIAITPDTVLNGQTLTAKISLGDSATSVSNIYGLAFTYNYDPLVIDTNSVSFAFIPSWIGSSANSINIHKNFSSGQVKAAITGIDHLARSGSGQVATFIAVVTTGNINGKDLSYYSNLNYISDITAIDQYGNPVPLNAGIDSNQIGYTPNSIEEIRTLHNLSIYPNPASTQVRISADVNITGLTITDILGETVAAIEGINTTSKAIDISQLSAGVYIVHASSQSGAATAKLVVSR